MADTMKQLIRRLIRRIPAQALPSTLAKWGRLTAAQSESIDFTESKGTLAEKLLDICEENGWTVKHITELEMTYIIDNPNQRMWYALQLMDPEDDAQSVELTQFKEQFKSHLTELKKPVCLKIKKDSDEAVWIRIAWGDDFSRPNHLKPTYIVHHLQTPYVFVTGLTSKQKPSLLQALVLSTRHENIKDANLSGRNLTAIRSVLMRQYQQVFTSNYPSPLPGQSQKFSDPHIEKEQTELAEKRLHFAREAFGGGTLPQLQSATYNLETKFKDLTNKTMMEQEEPLKCLVKFTSTNLLESLRQCASLGIASTPVAPLLSSIVLKGRNHFFVTDNEPGQASQTNLQQN